MSFLSACLMLLTICSLLLPGCKVREPKVQGNAAVAVNGVSVSEDEVAMKMQQMIGHRQPESAVVRARAIEELVEDELLYQQGKKLGLDRDDKFRQAVTQMEVRIKEFKRAELARRVRNTQIASQVEVSEEEVRTYYDRNKKNITKDYRLDIMRFRDEAAAVDARTKLVQGASFQAVATEMHAPSIKMNATPWDSGFIHWNQIPLELADAVQSLNDGEVSDVLGSQKIGWYIVKLIEKKNNPDAGYEQMSASIMNRLRDQKLLDAYRRYVEDLKKNAHIVKNDERRAAS